MFIELIASFSIKNYSPLMCQRIEFLTSCLLLLAIGSAAQQTCNQEFKVIGSPGSSNASGLFVSDNYPHQLPLGSSCTYTFRVYSGNVFCIRFEELDLFTDSLNSLDETRIEVRVESDFSALLEYSGNGSLFREQANKVNRSVVTRPRNLLEGPLCFLTPYYKSTFTVSVYNKRFRRPSSNLLRRFLARYENVKRVGNNSSLGVLSQVHRCLDGSVIDLRKRCNFWLDCKQGSSKTSDFFAQVSSDESYEHARCSDLSFGTSFSDAWMSGNRILDSSTKLECNVESDHSHIYNSVSDPRDCGLSVQQTLYYLRTPVLRLRAVRPTFTMRAACFRLYWKSSSFGSLTVASMSDDRALLRLGGRISNIWHMVEWESDSVSLDAEGFNVYSLKMNEDNVRPSSKHWLDDLSAEPGSCSESAYERRMPAVCSFEWSTCGWETDLTRLSDTSITNIYRVAFQDHTSELLPVRKIPLSPQRVLQLRGASERWTGSLKSIREIPYGKYFCLGFWFYAFGISRYSLRLDAEVEVLVSGEGNYFRMMTTAPTNQWRLLMAELILRQPGVPTVSVRLSAMKRIEVDLVLLDDLMIFADRCNVNETAYNGTADCGGQEWRCLNQIQCINIRKRCDSFFDCSDRSDEANCHIPRRVDADSWVMTGLQIFFSIVLGLSLIVAICAYIRHKSLSSLARSNARRQSPPRTVTDGRLPGPVRSDRHLSNTRLLRDRPPSYRQVTRGGAINAAFTADEGAPPPKYEDAVAAVEAVVVTTMESGECNGQNLSQNGSN